MLTFFVIIGQIVKIGEWIAVQNDNIENNIEYNDEELISELEQCREDERNSENQVIQVIVTAGTILALIFGVSSFGKYRSFLFLLSNLILCTTISYIASLGGNAVLRYHYMRDLEDKLFKMPTVNNHKRGIIHWNSFASAITTRNPKHLYNKYTVMNYLCYSLATVCPIMFCICITVFQYKLIEKKSYFDKLEIVFLFVFMISAIIIYFISSLRAPVIYEEAMKVSLKKRRERVGENMITAESPNKKQRKKGLWNAVGYYIYPKKKDFQKIFLLIVGYFTGYFFKYGNLHIKINNLKELVILCIIVDVLLYQARYQWNDIRGVKTDIDAGKNNRLPVEALGIYPAVVVSAVSLILKVAAAIWGSIYLNNALTPVLIAAIITIIISSILYEAARSVGSVLWTFIIVSFGYAIRFGVGVWCAYPQIWNEISHPIITAWILAYALFGEYSVALAWLQEVLYLKKKGIKTDKIHYEYLYKKFMGNCQKELSLKGAEKISDLWNLSYISSITILNIILIFVNIKIFIFGLLLIIFSVMVCTGTGKMLKLYISILAGSGVLGMFYSIYSVGLLSLGTYIYITEVVFAGVYLFLRFLFDPDFNFIKCCKNIALWIFVLFVGRETYLYITSESNKIRKK